MTSKRNIDDIVSQHRRCRSTTIQPVDTLTEGDHEELKQALPGVNIVQVIHVTDESSLVDALEVDHAAA